MVNKNSYQETEINASEAFSTQARRTFIRERLESKGVVTFKEIKEAFPNTKRASIHADAKALGKANIKVEPGGNKNDRYLTTVTFFHIHTKPQRKKINELGKASIGRLVASMILGDQERRQIRIDAGLSSSEYLLSRQEILTKLGAVHNKPWPTSEIAYRLQEFWSSQQRAICLDAGTTTESVAVRIQSVTLPSEQLTHLFVCTNSRGIFEVLGSPGCQLKTIVIGGTQQRRTEAICGVLAQQCLNAWNPTFGLSIIGATVIDSRTHRVGCFSDDEGMLKSNLLGRGSLKIILADHTKFQSHPMGAASPFTMISKSLVDLLISDRPFDGFAVEEMPVPVLFADE